MTKRLNESLSVERLVRTLARDKGNEIDHSAIQVSKSGQLVPNERPSTGGPTADHRRRASTAAPAGLSLLLAAALLLSGCCGGILPAHWQGSVSDPAPAGHFPGKIVGECAERQRANWGASAREGALACRVRVTGGRWYGVDCAANFIAGDPVWVPRGAGVVLLRWEPSPCAGCVEVDRHADANCRLQRPDGREWLYWCPAMWRVSEPPGAVIEESVR